MQPRSEIVNAIHAAHLVVGADRSAVLAAAAHSRPGVAHPVVLAWVINLSGDHVLLARHRTRGWSCPGGHVDEGENLIDAARRELLEETGIDATPDTDIPLWVATSVGCTRHPHSRHLAFGYRFRIDRAGGLYPEPDQPVQWFPLGALPTPRADDIDTLTVALRQVP